MTARRILSYAGWPALTGLLVAIILLQGWPGRDDGGSIIRSDGIVSFGPSRGQWDGPVSYSDAVELAAPAVVNIYSHKTVTNRRNSLFDDPFFRRFFNRSDLPQRERMESTLGSGVIMSDDGYIVTNNHVIAGAEQILVLLHDNREATATLVGTDPATDLAVLKINLDHLNAVPIGSANQAQVGDVVLAIGNPLGVGQTVTQGIISAKGRFGFRPNTYENFIQTDAAINRGSSGGALVDAYGKLLGINTAFLNVDNDGSSANGIAFAIPVEAVSKALNDIIEHGYVVRGWLGVEAQVLTPQLARAFDLPDTSGLVVTEIEYGGPASQAGLRPGDIIVRINDNWVNNNQVGMNLIANIHPGNEVVIDVLRNGESRRFKVIVGTRPPVNQ